LIFKSGIRRQLSGIRFKPETWILIPETFDSKGGTMATKCDSKTEVYSRVCGFFRPVQQWNKGKKEEFKERKEFVVAEGKRQG
jgi:ribonucleoside-triphosphate reductase